MPSVALASPAMPLWVTVLQGVSPILVLLLYKAAQYVIEGQSQRNARQIASEIRPGVRVRIKDRHGSFDVQHQTAGTITEDAIPCEQDQHPPADLISFPTCSAGRRDALPS
jgi:hypothetical protein